MPRLSIVAEGVVQGVGMRPFVYRAALEHALVGWVKNERSALRIEAQGERARLHAFLKDLEARCPSPARVARIAVTEIDERAELDFRIVASAADGAVRPVLPPDLAVCAACADEIATPGARRFRYPFTNCTSCGPRLTIVETLPYDRARTSMKSFAMCAACQTEHDDPNDRRFHAQPIACPACGPALELLSKGGVRLARGDEALACAVACVVRGEVLALKGLGGFQLLVDATCSEAVSGLRTRKRREAKPFAVLFSSPAEVRRYCILSLAEERVLASHEAPILLLARGGAHLAPLVAPGNPRIGAMLPATPLHCLLVEGASRPLVCTSGNLSDEPMCIDTAEALERLRGIADVFLVHDRPIVRPMDDSVVRLDAEGLTVFRRARGLTPLGLRLPETTPTVLALGGQLKSTVALAMDGEIVVSQHLGDLHSLEGALLHERTVGDMLAFFGARPEVIACDLHPDYASTRLAERLSADLAVPLVRVQHHHAHVAACMAEHGLAGNVLGFAWDGAGYGVDGVLWGGETLVCEGHDFRRVAHLRPFALPGGDRAVREPRRAALGLLYEVFGADAVAHLGSMFSPAEGRAMVSMIERSVNTPRTTSVGRLFDAVAALSGLATHNQYEGEAAMALEHAAEGAGDQGGYPLPIRAGNPYVADWEPLVRALLRDTARRAPIGVISARFHEAFAGLAESVALRAGLDRVVLSGGCFQNAVLTRRVRDRLVARGLRVYTPGGYPSNDGGLSLGQALVAARWLRRTGGTDVPRGPR